jgi:hypothetical protein
MYCVFCSAVAEELHHPTATLAGRHLDPFFTVPVCSRCHHAEHRAWRHAGLDTEDRPPALLRLRRLTWLATYLGDLDQAPGFGPASWQGLVGCLRAVLAELEATG